MDGPGSGPEAVAGTSWQAVPGDRHQDGQIKSIGVTPRVSRHPPGRHRTAGILGPDGPGSEGNLASNIENTSSLGNVPPQDKPAENPPVPASAEAEKTEKPSKSERPERAERAARNAAPPPPAPPAEPK